MKIQRLTVLLVMAMAGSQAAWAGPVQRNRIAGDAIWHVHLDIEKLKTTQVGQWFMGELEKPEAKQQMDAFQTLFNFDPRKKLRGCTLYSRGSAAEDAVMLLEGDFDATRLTVLARAAKEHESKEHRGYIIHGWLDERRKAKDGGSPHAYGAIHTNGVVAFGQKPERVGEALDVLDRLKPGLEKVRLPAQAGVSEHGVVVGVASQTDLGRFAPRAEFLKHFKTMALCLDESQNDLKLNVSVETQNEDAARNLQAMVQGLLAWGAFQGDRRGLGHLLDGIVMDQKGAMVTAGLTMPATNAIQMLKQRGPGRARPR